jgi:hypothetical protein
VTLSIKTRRVWSNRLAKLAEAQLVAQENVLVAIYMARQDGVTQKVIADSIPGLSATGVAAKARKGEEILRRRKGATSS